MSQKQYVAVDLGASNGRVLLGRWDGRRFALEEIHRFENGPVEVLGSLHWDVLRLWTDIKTGLARCAAQEQVRPAGIGVDTWGVDFALLDRAGRLLGNPYHYRDPRTDGVMERMFARVPQAEIYAQTGIQMMQINTLVQLCSMVESNDPQLAAADLLLPIPNLFSYWLTGQRVAEYTHATTMQCFQVHERRWATELLEQFEIPTRLLPPVVEPGTSLGPLLPGVAHETGLGGTPVFAVGSHDTASAVAAVPGLDANSVYISSGTWSLMGVELATPVVNDRALACNFTNEGGIDGTTRFLKNISGLWLVQECRRCWQQAGQIYSWVELLEQAEHAAPLRSLIDPNAPEFLNPADMPTAIREHCLRTGQEPPETVGAVVRCCLESLAQSYRNTLENLEHLVGRRMETIRIVGGGSQNHLLCQFTADACERPVVAGPVEATALGNLIVQAVADGELASVAEGRAAIADSVQMRRYEPG